MKKILLALALLIGSALPATAQGCGPSNPNCVVPTAPTGTSDSRAASTEFVQNQIAAGVPSSAIDALCSTNNDVLIRLSGAWQCSIYTANFNQPSNYPTNVTSGHALAILDADNQFGNAYSQYPIGSVSSNAITLGKAGSTIGSHTNGQLFTIVFTSSGLVGSPITITYTAGASETNDTVAAGLCALVNANTTLHGLGGHPIFCQALGSGGIFNLQYVSVFTSTGATPLTTATTGSTGTITLASEGTPLDYVLMQLGRLVAGRNGVAGDGLYALDFTGQDSTGAFNTHYAQITVAISDPTAGATHGRIIFNTASGAEYYTDGGLCLFDTSHLIATGGCEGLGTINIPATGAYFIGGATLANSTGIYVPGSNIFGGTAAGSALNLQSTQSGSPSGDFVEVTAGGSVRQTWFSDGGVTIGAPSGTDEGAGTLNLAGSLYNNGVAPNASGGYATITTGTWTPTIVASGTAGTPAYTAQVGTYERVGRQVTLRFTLVLSGWTGSPAGNITITGLPVAAANVANDFGHCFISQYAVSSGTPITGVIANNASVIIMLSGAATGTAALTETNTGTTPTLDGYCNYHT